MGLAQQCLPPPSIKLVDKVMLYMHLLDSVGPSSYIVKIEPIVLNRQQVILFLPTRGVSVNVCEHH